MSGNIREPQTFCKRYRNLEASTLYDLLVFGTMRLPRSVYSHCSLLFFFLQHSNPSWSQAEFSRFLVHTQTHTHARESVRQNSSEEVISASRRSFSVIAVEEEFLDILMFKKSKVQRLLSLFTKAISGTHCYSVAHKTYTIIICLCMFSLATLSLHFVVLSARSYRAQSYTEQKVTVSQKSYLFQQLSAQDQKHYCLYSFGLCETSEGAILQPSWDDCYVLFGNRVCKLSWMELINFEFLRPSKNAY